MTKELCISLLSLNEGNQLEKYRYLSQSHEGGGGGGGGTPVSTLALWGEARDCCNGLER